MQNSFSPKPRRQGQGEPQPPDILDLGGAIPSSGVKEAVVNGEKEDTGGVRRIISELGRGGFIFNASVEGDKLLLGVSPTSVNNQDVHHSDITEPSVSEGVVRGVVSQANQISLHIEASESSLSNPGKTEGFRNPQVKLARFFIEHGFPPSFILSEITKTDLTALGFEDSMETVSDLARQPLSTER